MLGYEPAELVGHRNHASIHHSRPDGTPIDAGACRMLGVMRTGTDAQISDEVLWRRDGSALPVEYRATPIRSHGPIIGAVVVFQDITDRKRPGGQQIHRLAFYDWLTGLPNRRLFKARLSKRVETQRRQPDGFALHLLDLDRFKEVNDTLGHPLGDALLREVAHRLQSLVRMTDTVARLGGDELAVIQPEVRELADAATLAGKIVKGLAEPYGSMATRWSAGPASAWSSRRTTPATRRPCFGGLKWPSIRPRTRGADTMPSTPTR